MMLMIVVFVVDMVLMGDRCISVNFRLIMLLSRNDSMVIFIVIIVFFSKIGRKFCVFLRNVVIFMVYY